MLVPVARCRQCNQFYWLINEEMYMPGCSPKRFRGESVTFICCDYVQHAAGKDVKYDGDVCRESPRHNLPYPQPFSTGFSSPRSSASRSRTLARNRLAEF